MDSHDSLHARGLELCCRGAFAEALVCLDRALAQQPDNLAVLLDRANALQGLGRRDEALAVLDRILASEPHHLAALNNRANLLQDLGRHDDALADYERAIAMDSTHPLLHNNRGMALQALGRNRDARASYERAIALDPDQPRPYHNLASLLSFGHASHGFQLSPAGSLLDAIPLYRKVLQLDPVHPLAGCHLATLLLELGRVEEAVPLLRASLQAQLQQRRHAGDQGSAQPLPPAWSALLMCSQYLPGADPAELGREARRWGEAAHARAHALLGYEPSRPQPQSNADRPLRLGYVSGDFTPHPVGLFLRCVLNAHDPARVTPFLYDNGSPADSLNRRLGEVVRRQGGDHRRVEQLDDLALARLIADDRIDILVDLAGHTSRSRLECFALRPAPLQLSWLGSFASTGLAAIDGLILDPVCAPADSEASGQGPAAGSQVVEPLLRLPHCRFCFQPAPFAPDVAPPPFERNGQIRFGSFNNTSKLNAVVLRSWARILQAVPDSRLMLRWRTFSDPAVAQALRQTMAELGVAPDRLDLLPSIAAYPDFLKAYSEIDLALDPFPFSGGQTSCEALWQGLPVLTLPGTTLVSRQTLSFLRAIGLDGELAARDQGDYEARAIALARDPSRLAALRRGLRDRMTSSPLCDVKGFTADFERLLEDAWAQLLQRSRTACAPVLEVLRRHPGEGADPALAASLEPLRQNPDDPLLLSHAGEWLRRGGHLREAQICLNRSLELQPEAAGTLLHLGLVLHQLGQIDAAIQAYRRSIRSDGLQPTTWMNLGLALVEAGQADAAIEAFRQALRIDPDRAVSQSNLGGLVPQKANAPLRQQVAGSV